MYKRQDGVLTPQCTWLATGVAGERERDAGDTGGEPRALRREDAVGADAAGQLGQL